MRQIHPKEKSMVARMAGNIAGAAYFTETYNRNIQDDRRAQIAEESVALACMILDAIEARVPCGECEECNNGNQCRELPKGEDDEDS